jgi:hypothetical protein
MRCVWIPLALMGALMLSGCARNRSVSPGAATFKNGIASTPIQNPSGDRKEIVTLEGGLVGKVAMVNPKARFAVLTFPAGRMAETDQPLSVYRNGLKVGEVRATAMKSDVNIVADIVAGEAGIGDEVRER